MLQRKDNINVGVIWTLDTQPADIIASCENEESIRLVSARFAIGIEMKACGTRTLVGYVIWETDVTASMACASVQYIWLTERVKYSDVHREVEFIVNDGHVFAGQFAGSVDAFRVPISPVQVVLEDSHSKGMWQIS